jgi:hypothetical protein
VDINEEKPAQGQANAEDDASIVLLTEESMDSVEEEDTEQDDLPVDDSSKNPLIWLKSGLSKIHPAFLIAAIVATIWIEWVMIPIQSFENHPTMWIGLAVYLFVTLLSIVLLKYLFSIRYKTLLGVMTANNLLLTIPLGTIISLATGYTLVQLLSPQWEFTHDFVYVMVVSQLAVTSILLFGVWWKTRKEVPTEGEEPFSEDDDSETLAERQPSLTHSSSLFTQRELHASSGMVNGLTNGVMNGVNGNKGQWDGLTNGLGMVNGLPIGLSAASGLTTRSARIPIKKSRKLAVPVAAFVIIAMLLFLPVLLVPSHETFVNRNWKGVASYGEDIEGMDPNVDVIEYSATSGEYYLWTKVKVSGVMMGNELPDTSTLHIFIDSDRDPGTGYSIGALGADHLVKVYGYEGVVAHSKSFKFKSDRDTNDWNAWSNIGSVSSSIMKDTLQTKIPMSLLDGEAKPIIYFGLIDSFGSQDYSDTCIDLINEGSLVIRQSNIAPDILERGSVDVVELELTARGRTIVLESIDSDLNAWVASSIPTPITIREDHTEKFTVHMDTTGMADGTLVDVHVNPKGIGTDQGTVTIEGTRRRMLVLLPQISLLMGLLVTG